MKVPLLMSEDDRKAFNFLYSYWNQIKLIENEKDQLELFKAICQVQFLEKDIDDIKFDNIMPDLMWKSIRYNIKQSVNGYKNKNKLVDKVSDKDFSHYVDAWNKLADKHELTKVIKLTDNRKIKLNTRINETQNFEKLFLEILKRIQKSKFLLGENDKNWKVSFDWIIIDDHNYLKVLEGKYE